MSILNWGWFVSNSRGDSAKQTITVFTAELTIFSRILDITKPTNKPTLCKESNKDIS